MHIAKIGCLGNAVNGTTLHHIDLLMAAVSCIWRLVRCICGVLRSDQKNCSGYESPTYSTLVYRALAMQMGTSSDMVYDRPEG